MTPKFVKLGDTYFRPEDIKRFGPGLPGRTRLFMTNGDEWSINMPANEVAAILNGSS